MRMPEHAPAGEKGFVHGDLLLLLLLVNTQLIKVVGLAVFLFQPLRFAGICATLGRGRKAWVTSPKRETIATSPA